MSPPEVTAGRRPESPTWAVRAARFQVPTHSGSQRMNQLQFEDGGRTYTCIAETSRATPDTVWWWVNVSGDGQRYAAFHKQKGDTAATLKPRIIAYYAKVLADRERPPEPRQHWSQRRAAGQPNAAKPAD